MLNIVRSSLAAAFLSVAALGTATAQTAPENQSPITYQPTHLMTEAPDDHAIGNPDAPDTLIVYASNMCPHCGDWFTKEWPTVKRDLVETGRLRFVFRPLPSAPIRYSVAAFTLAECAPADTYMAVIEDQFARQATILESQSPDVARTEFENMAKMAGLEDMESLEACLADDNAFAAVERATRRAQAANINGIPTFILNGEVMGGAHDAEDVARWLAGAGTSDDAPG
ncbi:MAG: thioredoxin domain-containing protein [Pseudomonadota bacterium]